jgi:putative ABC transport system permease protein
MNTLLSHAARNVFRKPVQTLMYLLGLMLAVGLFADTLFFVDLSQRDMTKNALAPVQVDMVARAATAELPAGALEQTLKGQVIVKSAEPVSNADFASLSKVGGSISSAAGKVFALNDSYYKTFGFLPIVSGQFNPKGAMVGDATATQLGLKVGDTIQIKFAAGIKNPYKIKVSGIVDMGVSEPLFYNPDPAGGEGYGVVADVVFLPPTVFERDLAPTLSKLPITTSSVGQTGSNVVLLPVERQVHLKIDQSNLNADPSKAFKQLEALRRSLERPFPGQVRVQNNLAKKLDNAKKDILAAKMLFLFLAIPGVLLAAYLSKYAVEPVACAWCWHSRGAADHRLHRFDHCDFGRALGLAVWHLDACTDPRPKRVQCGEPRAGRPKCGLGSTWRFCADGARLFPARLGAIAW